MTGRPFWWRLDPGWWRPQTVEALKWAMFAAACVAGLIYASWLALR